MDDDLEAGVYLWIRGELRIRLRREPTLEEIADAMEVSPRTVDSIRSRMRATRRNDLALIGADPDMELVDAERAFAPIDVEEMIVREEYVRGLISTAEAMRRLGMDKADESARRELRRWRARIPPR